MTVRIASLTMVAIAVLAGQTRAAAQLPLAVLDDRGTTVTTPVLGMRWRAFERGPAGQVVSGSTRVMVHLATAPWLGRRARIYMNLARTTDVDVAADWPGGGILAAGSLVSGGRALVYDGVIRDAALGDVLAMTVTTDGRRLTTATPLTFTFTIEVVP